MIMLIHRLNFSEVSYLTHTHIFPGFFRSFRSVHDVVMDSRFIILENE